MAQNDLSLADASGSAFRADANSALQAQASQQSGAAAPGTTYDNQSWADTTEHVLRVRNEGNSAWRILRTLDTDLTPTKTGAYTVALRDVGKLIRADTSAAGFSITLPPAASCGAGFAFEAENVGAAGNDVTLDGDGAETLNGVATLALRDGERALLVCTGSAWRVSIVPPLNNLNAAVAPTVNDDAGKGYRRGSVWLHGSTVYRCIDPAAGAAVWQNTSAGALDSKETIDLTNGGANDLSEVDFDLDAGFSVLFHARGVSSTTASWEPALRFRTAGGAVRATSGDYYSSEGVVTGTGALNTARTTVLMIHSVSPSVNTISLRGIILHARNAGQRTEVIWDGLVNAANVAARNYGGGNVQVAEDNDLGRFLTTAGTFDSGVLDIQRLEEVS